MTWAESGTRAERSRFLDAALAVGPVLAAGAIASIVTIPAIPVWYAGLAKPVWTPPNAVFGPAWTVLYTFVAVACWRLLRSATPGRSRALWAYGLQLALVSVWSPAFFGLRSPSLALMVIASLLVAIVATVGLAWRVDRIAAWCLAPYLAWVLYAASLNTAVVALNP